MNRKTKTIGAVTALLLLVLAITLFRGTRSGELLRSPSPLPGAVAAGGLGPSEDGVVGGDGQSSRTKLPRMVKSATGQEKAVRLFAGQELGRINGVVISLKDLLPLPSGTADVERAMSEEHYDFLFRRAVDRELTFQTAHAQGVQLTEEQRAALAEARARRNPPGAPVFDPVEEVPEQDQAEFEQRDFAALLLQATLADQAGVRSRHVSQEQVDSYYNLHRALYQPLPEDPALRADAWDKIEVQIRQRLAPSLQQEHDEQFAKYMENLRNNAKVSKVAIEP